MLKKCSSNRIFKNSYIQLWMFFSSKCVLALHIIYEVDFMSFFTPPMVKHEFVLMKIRMEIKILIYYKPLLL